MSIHSDWMGEHLVSKSTRSSLKPVHQTKQITKKKKKEKKKKRKLSNDNRAQSLDWWPLSNSEYEKQNLLNNNSLVKKLKSQKHFKEKRGNNMCNHYFLSPTH